MAAVPAARAAVESRAREQTQARLNERERIARDLHDTLLQGVTALTLHVRGTRRATSGWRAGRRVDGIQARLELRSVGPGGAGTVVTLKVPASIIYAGAQAPAAGFTARGEAPARRRARS